MPQRLQPDFLGSNIKFCRKLHRKIARLRAAQNTIHIGGGATKDVYLVDSVGKQTAVSGKDIPPIDRRYVVLGRCQYDRRAMHGREYIRQDGKTASWLVPKGDDGLFGLYV